MARRVSLFFLGFFLALLPFFLGTGCAYLYARAMDSSTLSLPWNTPFLELRLPDKTYSLDLTVLVENKQGFRAFDTVLLSRPLHTLSLAADAAAELFPHAVDAYNEYLFQLENP